MILCGLVMSSRSVSLPVPLSLSTKLLTVVTCQFVLLYPISWSFIKFHVFSTTIDTPSLTPTKPLRSPLNGTSQCGSSSPVKRAPSIVRGRDLPFPAAPIQRRRCTLQALPKTHHPERNSTLLTRRYSCSPAHLTKPEESQNEGLLPRGRTSQRARRRVVLSRNDACTVGIPDEPRGDGRTSRRRRGGGGRRLPWMTRSSSSAFLRFPFHTELQKLRREQPLQGRNPQSHFPDAFHRSLLHSFWNHTVVCKLQRTRWIRRLLWLRRQYRS